MKTIIFFTKDEVPDVNEQAALDALVPLTEPPFRVLVQNSTIPNAYGAGPLIPDYVMGEVPELDEYEELDVFDPDAPPAPETLLANQAVVYDTQEIELESGDTAKFTVVDGVVTDIEITPAE